MKTFHREDTEDAAALDVFSSATSGPPCAMFDPRKQALLLCSVCAQPAMAFKFRGVDFIEFDSLLSDDERIVRSTARSFIEDNLVPIIELCNREGRSPRELVKPMADLVFFGASLQGYGCARMCNVEAGLVR